MVSFEAKVVVSFEAIVVVSLLDDNAGTMINGVVLSWDIDELDGTVVLSECGAMVVATVVVAPATVVVAPAAVVVAAVVLSSFLSSSLKAWLSAYPPTAPPKAPAQTQNGHRFIQKRIYLPIARPPPTPRPPDDCCCGT